MHNTVLVFILVFLLLLNSNALVYGLTDEEQNAICADEWCVKYIGSTSLGNMNLIQTTSLAQLQQSTTTNSALARVSHLRLAVLESMLQSNQSTLHCEGIGERVVWDSAKHRYYCLCPYAHNCPNPFTSSGFAHNRVLISNIGADTAGDALAILLFSLGFALLVVMFFKIIFSNIISSNTTSLNNIRVIVQGGDK